MRVAVVGVEDVFGDGAGFPNFDGSVRVLDYGAKPFGFTSVMKGGCLSSAVVQIFVV